MPLSTQVIWLVLLGMPVACVSWTWTHEAINQELRDFLVKKSERSHALLTRKMCYALTCDYCFSHYVTILVLLLTGFKMLSESFTGYIVAWLSIVWVANLYLTMMAILRTRLKFLRQACEAREQSEADGRECAAHGAINHPHADTVRASARSTL